MYLGFNLIHKLLKYFLKKFCTEIVNYWIHYFLIMESRLMDVNTSAIKRRNEVSAGLKSKDYDTVFGALYSLNALLPEHHEEDGRQKYRITISDTLYETFTKYPIIVNCKKCDQAINFETVKVFDLIPPMILDFINTGKTEKTWICPKCKKDNKLIEGDLLEQIPKEPYFIRVVPKPPRRQDGIQGRTSYDRKVVQWAWRFMEEWEASMAQFRDDNWQKEEQVFMSAEDIDGGEANE